MLFFYRYISKFGLIYVIVLEWFKEEILYFGLFVFVENVIVNLFGLLGVEFFWKFFLEKGGMKIIILFLFVFDLFC